MKKTLSMLLLMSAAPFAAADDRGQLTLTFTVSTSTAREVLDSDGTWLHRTVVEQTARMVCPVETSGTDGSSYLAQVWPGSEAPASGRFQVWHSEGCSGTLTANNSVTVSKGGTVKPLERVTGSRPLSDADANVVVETDLDRSRTRLWIQTPQAGDFARESIDARRTAQLAAAPEPNVFVGPLAGPLKNGSFEKAVPGGRYRVDWVFQRGN